MESQANLNNQNDGGGNDGQQGDGQKNTPAFMAQLEKDLQSNERLAQFKNFSEMGRFVLDAEGKLKDSVKIPGNESTTEEKAAFYAKIGRPDKPDGYNITKPADLPEGIPYDPAFETAFKQFAHANNFSKQQAEEAYKWYYGLVVNGAAKQEADNVKAQTDGINALKDSWKDKFDGNKKIAEIAFKEFGKDAANLLDEAKIGNIRLGDHPAFLKVFYEIGIKTLDDTALKGGSGEGQVVGDKEAQTAAAIYPEMVKK